MPELKERFAQLLTEGVHRIRLRESKTIQVIQDELGYALGREGGASIEYWRKGHLPPNLLDIEKLAREIVSRGGLDREWLEKFLTSADYPYPDQFCNDLFPAPALSNTPPNLWNSDRTATNLTDPASHKLDDRSGTSEANPFLVGPPISHPRHFFGREYELKRIFALWRRPQLQNVAIIGLKRSGKTSLLHHLKNLTTVAPAQLRPDQQTDWLPQPKRYRCIFVDFQDSRMVNLERLLHYLLTSLDMPVPEPNNLENFMDVVSLQLDSPVIILMDEISSALASPELDQQFWGSLRSLGSNLTGGNLAYLLTSHEAPAQLAEEEGKPSPFFNIFGHTFTLGPLTEKEALELVASSPHPFEPDEVEWILAQSGCWPCLLQILCHARLVALQYGETGDAWKKEGIRQMAPYWYLLGA